MPRTGHIEIANLSQMAHILRCRQEYIKELVPLGLPHLEPQGRNWRFPVRAVLKWLNERGMAYGEKVRAETEKQQARGDGGPLPDDAYQKHWASIRGRI